MRYLIGILILISICGAYTPTSAYTWVTGNVVKSATMNAIFDEREDCLTDGGAVLSIDYLRAATLKATNLTFPTAKTKYLNISPAGIALANSASSIRYRGKTSVYASLTGATQALIVPIHLPVGSKVTRIDFKGSYTGTPRWTWNYKLWSAAVWGELANQTGDGITNDIQPNTTLSEGYEFAIIIRKNGADAGTVTLTGIVITYTTTLIEGEMAQ